MGLLQNISSRVFGSNKASKNNQQEKQALLRRCYFEVMEQRRVLSADPVIASVTYLEGDAGQDTTPDHFEVTFEGGAETTQLTQFTINGDQDLTGDLSDGDMFFDVNDQIPGTGGHHAFQFDTANSTGVTADDILAVSVSEDGLLLSVEIANFEAGDVMAFTIDVDEVERFRVDKIASGVEFEGSFFSASFVDQHYTFAERDMGVVAVLEDGFVQPQREGIFYDEYNTLFGEGENVANETIDLTRDNEQGFSDRTAGALDAYDLIAKPVSIEGNVYHDRDMDCEHDANEEGIAGVEITLQRLDELTGSYVDVATTLTDAEGHYVFGEDLGLMPGDFRVVETQPDGYLNVGESAGSGGGDVTENVISEIRIPLGGTHVSNYDFCEVQPAELKGTVWHDANNDGIIDSGEDRLGGVIIELFDKQGNKIAETRTDANGAYCFDQLYPGEYIVRESQPDGFIDGLDAIGQVNGLTAGDYPENDEFCVKLEPGDAGTNYDFGELLPSSISGTVHADINGDCVFDPAAGDLPLSGVELILLDGEGNEVARTVTDQNGNYEFTDLTPGTYSVRELTPDGYVDGGELVGQVAGANRGVLGEDLVSGINLASGEDGTGYDFCEHIPAQLCGTVYHDRNDNGVQDVGEEGIEGTRMVLTDENGNVIAETFTDSSGDYCFKDLVPGTYCVKEIQPDGYLDGMDSVGDVNGLVQGSGNNDEVCNIELMGGDNGDNYDFGEIQLAEISGRVHVDANGDCVYEPGAGDKVLANVKLELLDSSGNVIAETMTDAEGNYRFTGIMPGEYSIRQMQPDGYFNGGELVGDGGGDAGENLIENIRVQSGQKLTQYDFCEVEAAEIHGRVWEDGPAIETTDGQLPDDYRSLRDGVYEEDVDTPLAGVRMELYFYVDPTNSEIAPRPVTLGEVQAEHYHHMGTTDPDAAVWVETMANGEYWFMGLPAGNYIVLETQPEGLYDSSDTPGTTTGFTYNSAEEANTAPQSLVFQFSNEQIMDSVVNIRVNAGQVSELNNFSEVGLTVRPETPDEPQIPNIPPTPPRAPSPLGNPITPSPGMTGYPGLYGSQPSAFTQFIGTSRGASFQTHAQPVSDPYTWHLSVVNGGQPRNISEGAVAESVWQPAGHISNGDWARFDMNDAVWTFSATDTDSLAIREIPQQIRFGMLGGTPLAGDFDGDGKDEVAVFNDGYWMIDINRNGTWDEGDLLAKLGDFDDRPVVGDWDGDGKDDIGIYGPIWELDREAIERDPGLPNPENQPHTRPKNIPPMNADATNGGRVMKLTSFGKQRADVVDHVFGVGDGDLVPVTGDWNGNGIRSIGTFENGQWQLDVNGDGEFSFEDATASFGRTGDVPLVGDFDGDGVEEIAVYRSGSWMIDSNGNRELDATDRTFQMGGAHDMPVVGDWDGDGIDEPGLYTEQSNSRLN